MILGISMMSEFLFSCLVWRCWDRSKEGCNSKAQLAAISKSKRKPDVDSDGELSEGGGDLETERAIYKQSGSGML